MNNNKKVAVIGGGASGIVAGIFARRQGYDVTIYEGGDRIGKKILQTGNGRCNFCNDNLNGENYNNPEFVNSVFAKFTKDKILKFFDELGLAYYKDDEGRYYPCSNSANSVLDVLRFECERLNINIVLGSIIDKVTPVLDKYKIGDQTFDKVIVACGNANNNILAGLGHRCIEYKEGLTGLSVKKDEIIGLQGVRAKCVIKLINNNLKIVEKGEMQFKQEGISGICVFNISSIISRKGIKNCVIFADFIPNYSKNDLINLITQRCKSLRDMEFIKTLSGIINKSLAQNLCKRIGINFNEISKNISSELIIKLVDVIKECPFHVEKTLSGGQVKVGGLDLNLFDDNLQSKLFPNMYACGECLNIDGLCGGFNLAWAWASGAIAGSN